MGGVYDMSAFEVCVILESVLLVLLVLCYGGLAGRVEKLEEERGENTK